MPGDGSAGSSIRAFLIADVRGYTLFTQERGDEAAAKLAGKFARVVREAVERRGGSLLELRGDEALVVFDSPRQAIRTAVELQEWFVDETLADPTLPLTVGIGLDAGEAVPVEGGYRGGALNVAARLCGEARAGECLATHEVAHLARTVEGVRYQERGALSLKGLSEPVRVVRLLPADGDPAIRLAPVVTAPRPPTPRGPFGGLLREHRAAAALVTAVLVAAAVAVTITRGGDVAEITSDSVGVLDAASGAVVATVELDGRPGAVAAGEGAVWIAQPDRGVVVRIDPETRARVDTIEVGSDPAAIATGAGAVWVANAGTSTISRISPDTNTVTQTIDAPSAPSGIAVGAGSVWVTSTISDTVSRLDTDGDRFEESIGVGDRPDGVAVVGDQVWVANSGSGTVSRVAGDAEVAVVDVGNGPSEVASATGEIWVSNGLDGTVSRVDPATNTVTSTIRVGEEPGRIVTAGGAVWIANQLDGTLVRIEADAADPETVALGSEVTGAAEIGEMLWVGVRASDAVHRGGTLTVISTYGGPDSIDPAVAYSGQSWTILASTNDGLVGFENAGGVEGSTLVPNLATSLPTPTEGGTTYSFQLRRGIRYSNGEPVRPEDFRRGIERTFTAPPVPDEAPMFFASVLGADACDTDSCDLSEGIVTDAGSNTVTFRLAEPDPEFLNKLALPFGAAVPRDAPDEEVSDPLPSTGPYRIVEHSETELVMARNPLFEEWSAASRPDGFPDRIVWRFTEESQRAVDDLLGGRGDLLYAPPDIGTVEQLRTRHPGQVHAFPAPQTWFLNLDTTFPPFDDVRVRRALNLALDREHLVEVTGGVGSPSCQILPPNFPGYQPYCPYTEDPSEDGTWDGPDVLEGQRLVRESGTVGARVSVWASPMLLNGAGTAVGEHVEDVLSALGYRPRLTVIEDFDEYAAATFEAGERMHAFVGGWIADYPEESGYIPLQFECGSFANFTGFCDPDLDRRMAAVRQLQVSDPSAATAEWAEIERAIMDQAPIVPLVNIPIVQVVSERVGNYQPHPQWTVLVDQLWVR